MDKVIEVIKASAFLGLGVLALVTFNILVDFVRKGPGRYLGEFWERDDG